MLLKFQAIGTSIPATLADFAAAGIARALVSPYGIVQGYNQVLGERGIALILMEAGMSVLANRAVETRG